MSNIKFTQDHEWVRIDDENAGVIGITDYAQEQLGEVVYIELPEPESEVEGGEECGAIESVKAAGELKSPVSGMVTAVNERLADEPELLNSDPTGDGWIAKIELSVMDELDELMDEGEYASFLDSIS